MNKFADNNFSEKTVRGDMKTFALIVEPEGVADWNRSGEVGEGKFRYTGPASNTITDPNAEIYVGKYWEYNNRTGKITLK